MPISPALGLESGPDSVEVRSEAAEHVFDHVIGTNQKHTVSNFSRQMPIAKVPRKTHQLYRVLMSDFYKLLSSSSNL